mgnify:FL=1
MAYTLNTGHALYASLVELFGVQGGALVSHKTARTFTKHADATYGTGTWGEHFSSLAAGYTAKGAAFSPYLTMNTNTYPNYTVVAVVNASGAVQGGATSLFMARSAGGDSIRTGGKTDSGNAAGYRVAGSAMGTGPRMITYCRIGATAAKLYSNTTLDVNSTGLGADYGSPDARVDYLGGWDGQNSMTASIVWLAVFNKELSLAEISDLHASLGASNAFGLVSTANAAPTFPGPNIGNQTGTVGTALSANTVSDSFSDSDALTFSAIGSWPPGVTVSSAGVISGTPTTAGTYSTLQVRATDTAAQTVDSDVFSFTISAAGTDANFAITSDDATFSGGGVVRPMASFAVTAADATFSGGGGLLALASFNAATANATFAGGATGDVTQGTITCPALKNNTGAVLANETGVTAYVYSVATGAHVATKTGQTTNPSGILTFTDAAIAAGTTYRVVIVLGSGAEGMDKVAAT